MLIFAVVALLVGAFMIFNTFSITVAQRTRENGLLRALGASRRQVLASVLLEALRRRASSPRCSGSSPGSASPPALKALLDALGFDIPAGGVVFTPGTAVISLRGRARRDRCSPRSRRPARRQGAADRGHAAEAVGSTGYGSKAAGHRRLPSCWPPASAALLTGLFADVAQRALRRRPRLRCWSSSACRSSAGPSRCR